MRMHTPPHPGQILRQECLAPFGRSVTDAAQRPGVNRNTLNDLVNGRAGISPEMAVRLSKAFGSTPRTWLGLQMDYDLSEAKAHSIAVEPVPRPAGDVGEPTPQR